LILSQSGLLDRSRDAAWDAWYVEHLHTMVTVPGISSAQRFKTETAGFPPSLAMYSVASAAVFDDPYYLNVRGLGEWKPLVDMRYYRRNLFAGLGHAPDVAAGEALLVADRDQPEGEFHGISFTWLEAVGIDRSTPYRGVAVAAFDLAVERSPNQDLAVYTPATHRIAVAPRQADV
jgi:hypothetical protein